jgi:hypothetical protein
MIDVVSMCLSCGNSFYLQTLEDPGDTTLKFCPFCASTQLRDLDDDLIPSDRRQFVVLDGGKKKTPPEEAGSSSTDASNKSSDQ